MPASIGYIDQYLSRFADVHFADDPGRHAAMDERQAQRGFTTGADAAI